MKVTAIFTDGTTTTWTGIEGVLNDVQIAGAHFTLRADDAKRYLWLNPAMVKTAELVGDEGEDLSRSDTPVWKPAVGERVLWTPPRGHPFDGTCRVGRIVERWPTTNKGKGAVYIRLDESFDDDGGDCWVALPQDLQPLDGKPQGGLR